MLQPGTIVGRDYRVVRPLSEGGMGAVFVAEQISTGRPRALKVMHRELVADAGLRKRFELEARVGSRIQSEHVVEVVGAGVDEPTGMPWIAMELLEGSDLRAAIKARGGLPLPEARELFAQLGDALGAAHAAGVVHRDLKAENIFLARSRRGPFTVKVLDFGIARVLGGAATQGQSTRSGLGTPLYMAPEQSKAGAAVTPATDVWALGLIAFEVLTGRAFWNTARAQEATPVMLAMEAYVEALPLASARASELGRASAVPPGFDAWFAHAVARDPKDRYPEAGSATRSLCAVLESAPVAPEPALPVATSPRASIATSAPTIATDTGLSATALAPPTGIARSSRKVTLLVAAVTVLGVAIGATVVVAGSGLGPSKESTSPARPGTGAAPGAEVGALAASELSAAVAPSAAPVVEPTSSSVEATASASAVASSTATVAAPPTPAPPPASERPRRRDSPPKRGGVYVPPAKL